MSAEVCLKNSAEKVVKNYEEDCLNYERTLKPKVFDNFDQSNTNVLLRPYARNAKTRVKAGLRKMQHEMHLPINHHRVLRPNHLLRYFQKGIVFRILILQLCALTCENNGTWNSLKLVKLYHFKRNLKPQIVSKIVWGVKTRWNHFLFFLIFIY